MASRGLGLVYDLSGPQNQNDLANSLLDQLIGGKRQVKQVNDDTVLFEEGVLGKTPTGYVIKLLSNACSVTLISCFHFFLAILHKIAICSGNITTYKELCSLASDLNKPEMIYQFMQLANHNSTWNSKLGAAFGLKSINKAANDQMKPHLEKIVPRLYRYKYDPTPRIQNSMISIWDSIVSDSKETVEMYYWAIFDELVTNVTHTEWRVRIACCLAIRDLIKSNKGLRLRYHDRQIQAVKMDMGDSSDCNMDVDPIEGSSSQTKMDVDGTDLPSEPDLLKLWIQLFRVMDDVHEGTRNAAEGTAKHLSKVISMSINVFVICDELICPVFVANAC